MLLTHHLLRETSPSPGLTHQLEPKGEGRRVAPDGDLARVRLAALEAPVWTLSTAVRAANAAVESRRRQDPSTRLAANHRDNNQIVLAQMLA